MKFERKLENIKKYEKIFKSKNIDLDYNNFSKYFYTKIFFYNYEIPLLEENFYETTLEICINIIKPLIQELEYFVNVKPNNLIASSDYEIINKNTNEIETYYLKLYKLYKKYIKLHLKRTENEENKEVYHNFIIESFNKVKEYTTYSIKIQEKLIINIDNKINEIQEKNKELKFEGSVYM